MGSKVSTNRQAVPSSDDLDGILNDEYEWGDVRYQISNRYDRDDHSRQVSYDVALSFEGIPEKQRLEPGVKLYRIDFPIVFGIFTRVWWMKEAAFYRIFKRANSSSSALRREWQHSLAMGKPRKGKKGDHGGRWGEAATRTQVLMIEITQPVRAWVGKASPLNNKCGGEEQVYLPNLARGTGPYRSEYARHYSIGTLAA
jgi:hypothetical protein